MNGQHFKAFLWLRWRLQINQLKRGGIANAVILALLAVAAVLSAVALFVVFLCVGLFALNDVEPGKLMYVLDGVVIAFLFLWITGLLTELQRSEALSLNKFLHLPVSLSSAFFINYLSSLPSVSLLWFLSATLGLSLGLLISRGASMLLLLPMLAAFVLMVTALTYQFQGWLATLMTNPRRRRTIIVTTTMIFILLCQAPNLVNILSHRHNQPRPKPLTPLDQRHEEIHRDIGAGKPSHKELSKRLAEFAKREQEMDRETRARQESENKERSRQMEETVRFMNLTLPPGWLPAGVEAAAEGRPWYIVLAILGPALIGSASLYRAYRTTLRLYTGQYTSGQTAVRTTRRGVEGKTVPSPVLRDVNARASRSPSLLERKLPWLSEQAAVIALASFRSILRAPETKMFLLSMFLLLIIFGSGFLVTTRADIPEAFRPMIAFGAMVMVLFSMSQLLGNQFGFDRDGFRVFVLSPADRRDVLLGKNLAVAPIALTMASVAAVLVQIAYPMRLDRFLALAPRFLSMYLLYCLAGNIMSILTPMRIAPSSFQPARPGGLTILLQLVFMFLCPPILALTLIPLGIEWAAEEMRWRYGIPLDLILTVLEFAAIAYIYVLILRLQGDWLQAREQRILQIVTTRAN